MKNITILIIGMFFLNISSAQEIEMKLNLFGPKFIQNGQKLTWKKLVNATESNIDANLLIKKAKNQHTVSTVLAFVGGGLVGISLGQLVSDKDPNWTLAYIGGGIGVVGIPFSFSAFNNVNKGIDAYNISLKSTSFFQFKPEFKVISNGNGIGLLMTF